MQTEAGRDLPPLLYDRPRRCDGLRLHRHLPHAVNRPRCALANCTGVNYTGSVVRDILLAGIYDVEIRRDVLSDPSMATRPINDIILVIESKESARDAVSSPAPRTPAPEAAAASSSFKSAGKQPPTPTQRAPKPQAQKGRQQNPPQNSGPMLPSATPRRLRCACGEYYMDFAQYQSGKWNTSPHTCCKACHLRNKPPRPRYPTPTTRTRNRRRSSPQ